MSEGQKSRRGRAKSWPTFTAPDIGLEDDLMLRGGQHQWMYSELQVLKQNGWFQIIIICLTIGMATSNILVPTIPLVKRVIFVSGPHADPSPITDKQADRDGQPKTPIIPAHDHLQNSRLLPVDNESNGDSVPDFHSNQYSDTQTIRETHHHKTIAAAICQLNYEVTRMQKRIEQLHQRLDAIEDSEGQKIKKKRRKAQEIQKNYQCPYENCEKSYGTEVSLNLHIKLKHNGGTKTERQQFMRMKLAGHNVQPKISLPPEMLKSLEEVTSSK